MEIKHIITENWEEELLRSLVGSEEITMLKYPDGKDLNTQEYIDACFDSETEWIEVTIKRIPK